jgi:hypothetical protein
VTCKKKHGDFNFTLQSRESDFSQYRARISPDLVSPGYLGPGLNLLVGFQHSLLYIQIYNCQNRFIKKNKTRNSCPILAEVALPRLQSEIKVAMFLFASHSFLVNNLRFMIKLIDKAIATVRTDLLKKTKQ